MPETLDASLAKTLYFDRALEMNGAKLLPGEYYVTAEEKVLVTVLGSCVSACIRDASSGIGGMNHFMLPDGGKGADGGGATARYGVYAMEVLINSLLKMGARKQNFEAKVFGGGNIMRSLSNTNVGKRNSEFVLEFLNDEKIRIVAQDLETVYPRKIFYFPRSGLVRVKKLRSMHDATIRDQETVYVERIAKVETGGEVELFN